MEQFDITQILPRADPKPQTQSVQPVPHRYERVNQALDP